MFRPSISVCGFTETALHATANPEEEEVEKLPSGLFSLREAGSPLRRSFKVSDWETGSSRLEEHAAGEGEEEGGGVVKELIARDEGAAIFADGGVHSERILVAFFSSGGTQRLYLFSPCFNDL